jgi:hypothetical protein
MVPVKNPVLAMTRPSGQIYLPSNIFSGLVLLSNAGLAPERDLPFGHNVSLFVACPSASIAPARMTSRGCHLKCTFKQEAPVCPGSSVHLGMEPKTPE